MADTFYCEKCNRTMDQAQFYGSNNLNKYADGKLRQCKKCITMHVDNFNPDTYLWILQECDVPYIPEEWKEYRWKDNDFLQELANNKIEQTMKRQGYDAQDIALAIDKASVAIPEGELSEPVYAAPASPIGEEDYFAIQSGADDFVDDLTEEDRTYLRLKWGKTYKPEEWVRLEQLYEEMMASYDIQGAGHIDTLKLICKTSLKANQLIDIGDIEGFQKMSKVYDSLMKSGKFTAAQNKAESGEFVDSVGELIELCEKQGYIERFYTDSPKDKVDLTIQDMQRYTKSLIEGETNLTLMVEKALRENAKEDADAAANNEDTIIDDVDISLEDLEKSIRDEDYIDFEEFLDAAAEADAALED